LSKLADIICAISFCLLANAEIGVCMILDAYDGPIARDDNAYNSDPDPKTFTDTLAAVTRPINRRMPSRPIARTKTLTRNTLFTSLHGGNHHRA